MVASLSCTVGYWICKCTRSEAVTIIAVLKIHPLHHLQADWLVLLELTTHSDGEMKHTVAVGDENTPPKWLSLSLKTIALVCVLPSWYTYGVTEEQQAITGKGILNRQCYLLIRLDWDAAFFGVVLAHRSNLSSRCMGVISCACTCLHSECTNSNFSV